MRTVHKFLVPAFNPRFPEVPAAPLNSQAKVVHVGSDPQTGDPAIWAEVITEHDAEPKGRTFAFFGTGWDIQPGWSHVGTAICGQFVWHVYEQIQR